MIMLILVSIIYLSYEPHNHSGCVSVGFFGRLVPCKEQQVVQDIFSVSVPCVYGLAAADAFIVIAQHESLMRIKIRQACALMITVYEELEDESSFGSL